MTVSEIAAEIVPYFSHLHFITIGESGGLGFVLLLSWDKYTFPKVFMMISIFNHLSGLKTLMLNIDLSETFGKEWNNKIQWTQVNILCGLQDLKDYMRQAGEVTYADAHKQHRNEGLVLYFYIVSWISLQFSSCNYVWQLQ